MSRLFTIGLLTFLMAMTACNLQQEIDLNLPEYESEVVVESYLRPGFPLTAVLTESVSFFDTLELRYVRNATVVMDYGDRQDTLRPLEIDIQSQLLSQLIDTALLIRFGPLFGESLVIYTSFSTVPARYDLTYRLLVITEEGDTLRAQTNVPAPVEYQDHTYRFNDDGKAIFISTVQDDPNQADYYRRLLQRRVYRDSMWSTRTDQDFLLDDAITNGELITFGSGFDYEVGDTLISGLYHTTRDYVRFAETRDAAIAASLSPFSQPAILHTNIEGGQGLFAGLTLTRDTVVIEN